MKKYMYAFYLLFSALCLLPSAALAANRPISQKWDVRHGTSRRMPIQWFAGESVAFDLEPLNGRTPLDLSGATVIWEITDWDGLTNAYLSATGTVSGTTASWLLTPEQSNLPEGTYNGYARAITGSDERVVLAWQSVKVLWSPSSDNYLLAEPQPLFYTKAEVDVLLAGLGADTIAVSNASVSADAGIVSGYQAADTLVSNALAAVIADAEPGNYASVSNNAITAFGWGDHAFPGYLTSYTETDPAWNSGTGAIYSAIGLKLDAADSNNFATAAQGALADGAAQVSDNALGSGATATTGGAIGTDASTTVGGAVGWWANSTTGGAIGTYTAATDGGGAVGQSAYGLSGGGAVGNNAKAVGGFSGGKNARSAIDSIQLGTGTNTVAETLQIYSYQLLAANGDIPIDRFSTPADLRYVQPQVSSDYLTLDREIASWEDIGVTYSNAVTLNSPITITNDSAWTGWTTTGTLTASNTIFLTIGQYLLSPVQSNGIAHVDAEVWSDRNATAADIGIYTNGVLAVAAAPWRAAGGQWRVEAGFSLPGATPGIHIDSATLISYTDLTEAATRKDVSNLGVIDDPFNPTDVANMRYVDQQDTAARAYTDDELDTYAADPDKTLRGAELRLGNMWVVSPADTSGDRFIVSGGEISGSGQLIGTTNDFIISKNDYPLMSFQSASTGLYITNYTMGATSSNVTVTLNVATNGVIAAPFAEWSDSLVVGEWSRISTYDTESYPAQTNGAYELTFTLDLADTMYFRAMQPIGESVATVKTDVFDFGTSVIRFHGSVDGTNRVAELSWDFTNNVFSVEVTDE